MAQVWHFVDPKPVRSELKNATVGLLLDQRKRERVAIKRDGLIVGMRRTFDRNIGAAGESRSIKFRHHAIDLTSRRVPVKDGRPVFERWFSLFRVRWRHLRIR